MTVRPAPRWGALARVRLSRRLALTGGGLGLGAGMVQTLLGGRLPTWTGDKDDPVVLGLVTVAASAVVLLGARVLPTAHLPTGGRRTLVAATWVVPAGLCASTVGRLWWVLGGCLVAATVALLSVGPLREVGAALVRRWLRVLVSVLGATQLVMAATASPSGRSCSGSPVGCSWPSSPGSRSADGRHCSSWSSAPCRSRPSPGRASCRWWSPPSPSA